MRVWQARPENSKSRNIASGLHVRVKGHLLSIRGEQLESSKERDAAAAAAALAFQGHGRRVLYANMAFCKVDEAVHVLGRENIPYE